MQLDFLFTPDKRSGRIVDVLQLGSKTIPVQFVRNHRARRYIIRISPDGSVRATVPRVGSNKEARAFAERHADWIVKQLEKRQEDQMYSTSWRHGTEILYRGETVELCISSNHAGHVVHFGDQTVPVAHVTNLRAAIERHLRKLATVELPGQTLALAQLHGLAVKRVSIRNQRSRWGSCSRRGTISLNWRLILLPVFACEYVIIHELMHLRELNHSQRFWQEVAAASPNYRKAKAWIRQHRELLR